VDTGDSAKRAVRVTIFKQAYTLRTTGDAADTEALAAGVDELMHRIADRAHSDDPSRVAVLAALHLADKLRGLERRARELEERAQELKLHGEQAEHQVEEWREKARNSEQQTTALERRTGLRQRLAALENRLAALLETTDDGS